MCTYMSKNYICCLDILVKPYLAISIPITVYSWWRKHTGKLSRKQHVPVQESGTHRRKVNHITKFLHTTLLKRHFCHRDYIQKKLILFSWKVHCDKVLLIKESFNEGGSSPKKSAVVFEKRQVKPFLKIEHTMYIFPTWVQSSNFFFKSKNLK